MTARLRNLRRPHRPRLLPAVEPLEDRILLAALGGAGHHGRVRHPLEARVRHLKPDRPPKPEGVGVYSAQGSGWLATGTGRGGAGFLSGWDTADLREPLFTLSPFGAQFKGGVRPAVGDLNGDGVLDFVAAQGPGGANLLRAFDGRTLQPFANALGRLHVYITTESDGVSLALADVNGDGRDDIITGTQNGRAAVSVRNGRNGAVLAAFKVPDLQGGAVRVGGADLTGDGRAEVIVARSTSSRIIVLDVASGAELFNYFAFDPFGTEGVHLALGDLTGDGTADVVAGSGGLVRVFAADSSLRGELQPFGLDYAGPVRVGLPTPTATAPSTSSAPRATAAAASASSTAAPCNRWAASCRTARPSATACSSPAPPGAGARPRAAGAASASCPARW
jgi:hypothetical protein